MKNVLNFCLFMMMLTGVSLAQTEIRIKADRVNLRAQPSLSSEVVGQAGYRQALNAISFKNDWVELSPPTGTVFYVYSEMVQDGLVSANELNVRSGPGLAYSTVGRIPRGTRLSVLGTFGEWLKIEPVEGTSVWVSRDFVEVMMPKKATPAPTVAQPHRPSLPSTRAGVASPRLKAPGPQAAMPVRSAAQVETAQMPPPPEGLKLVPLKGQGHRVQREGQLRGVGWGFNHPTRFRLLQMGVNGKETLCYVLGNDEQLQNFIGKTLLIRGREYWVQGVRLPVLRVEELVPRAGE